MKPPGPDEIIDALKRDLGSFDQLRVSNHWVPETYLKPFTGRDEREGLLWMYDRTDPTAPRSVAPKAVAKENYLYVTDKSISDIGAPDIVERILDKYIERPFALVRNKLVYGLDVGLLPILAASERSALALFLAIQQGRTPFHQSHTGWLGSFFATLEIRTRLENVRQVQQEHYAQTGKLLNARDLKEWRKELDAGTLRIKPGKEQWLVQFLQIAYEIASDVVRHLPWRIIRSPDHLELPTSDIPMVIARRVDRSSGYKIGGGWLDPYAEAVISLSPHHILALGLRVEQDPFIGSEEWFRHMRELLVRHSERFVFARSQASDIPELLGGSETPYPVIEFEGEEYPMTGPVGPVVKKLMRSRSEVVRFGTKR